MLSFWKTISDTELFLSLLYFLINVSKNNEIVFPEMAGEKTWTLPVGINIDHFT